MTPCPLFRALTSSAGAVISELRTAPLKSPRGTRLLTGFRESKVICFLTVTSRVEPLPTLGEPLRSLSFNGRRLAAFESRSRFQRR